MGESETPDPAETPRDHVEDRSFLEAERARAEAERLRGEFEESERDRAKLRAQVDELKSLVGSPEAEPAPAIQRMHLLHIQPVRDILVIGMVVGVFWLGYVLRAITIPMLLALTLAYLVEPVVRRLVARGFMSRVQAAAFMIMVAVVVITVPLTVGSTIAITQGVQYSQKIRDNVALVQKLVNNPDDPGVKAEIERSTPAWRWIAKTASGFANPPAPDEPIVIETPPLEPEEGEPGAQPPLPAPRDAQPPGPPLEPEIEPQSSAAPPPDAPPPTTNQETTPSRAAGVTDWVRATFEQNLQGIGRLLARYLVGTGAGALDIGVRAMVTIGYLVFAMFLVLFFFFFFSVGYERVTTSFANLIPTWKRQRTLNLLSQMDAVIAGFVRGRLIIMGILMVMFTVGYWLIGVPGALILGPITGILAVVPYLGLISIPAAMLLMWLQPVGVGFQQSWWWILAAPVALYFLIQTIEDYLLTPAIQGKATQMDVPSILFAVLAGGILAGFYGILLAIPAAACIKILLRETFWPRFEAWAEGKVKDFLPISRYDPTETGRSSPPERKGQ